MPSFSDVHPMARLQIEEGLHLIAQRIRRPELAGQVTWRHPGVRASNHFRSASLRLLPSSRPAQP